MNKRIGLVIAGVAATVIGGGTAFGAVSSASPMTDSGGNIYGCYDSGGNLKVIDPSLTTTCPKGWSPLAWNQSGPTGPKGDTGLSGPAGPAGPAGSQGATGAAGTGAAVISVPAGDPNCPSGGASITDGNGNRTYACDGAAGQAGPPGPQGPQGPQGTNAAPEFSWTFSCASGECGAGANAANPIFAGVLTPVSITGTGGNCPDEFATAKVYDSAGNELARTAWSGNVNTASLSGPDTISAASSNGGPLKIVASGGCGEPLAVTFTFDVTQSYS